MAGYPKKSAGRSRSPKSRWASTAMALSIAIAGASASYAGESEPAYDVLPVPTVTIYPGEVIRPDMLAEMHFLPGTRSKFPVVDASETAVGKVAKRTLLPERLIPANALAEPELVARGSLVRASYEQGSLSITTSVVALDAGALGEVVRVRNVDSGQVIWGSVQPDGTVRVGPQ